VLLLPYGFVVGWFTKEDKFQLADCDFSWTRSVSKVHRSTLRWDTMLPQQVSYIYIYSYRMYKYILLCIYIITIPRTSFHYFTMEKREKHKINNTRLREEEKNTLLPWQHNAGNKIITTFSNNNEFAMTENCNERTCCWGKHWRATRRHHDALRRVRCELVCTVSRLVAKVTKII
jgi:hypothetical protein